MLHYLLSVHVCLNFAKLRFLYLLLYADHAPYVACIVALGVSFSLSVCLVVCMSSHRESKQITGYCDTTKDTYVSGELVVLRIT